MQNVHHLEYLDDRTGFIASVSIHAFGLMIGHFLSSRLIFCNPNNLPAFRSGASVRALSWNYGADDAPQSGKVYLNTHTKGQRAMTEAFAWF